MRWSVNRMALCKILVPFIKENLEFQPTGDLRGTKIKGQEVSFPMSLLTQELNVLPLLC